MNNPVLDGCQVVDILDIDCRFRINEEEIQRLFCLSVSDICYVSNHVPRSSNSLFMSSVSVV